MSNKRQQTKELFFMQVEDEDGDAEEETSVCERVAVVMMSGWR